MQTVAQTILGILNHKEFTEDIVDSLGAAHSADGDVESTRQDEFAGLLRRVTSAFHSREQAGTLYEVLRDDTRVRESALIEVFNFIYFYLVNQFKAELAECLARPILRAFAHVLAADGRAPAAVRICEGHRIRSRRARGGHVEAGWYKGADALIVVATDELTGWDRLRGAKGPFSGGVAVFAVAEIKAYRAAPERILDQINRHTRRLAFGTQIEGKDLDTSRCVFVTWDVNGDVSLAPFGRRVPIGRIARIVVRPGLAHQPSKPLVSSGIQTWTAELPSSSEDLSEAAYRFTDWFLGRVGQDIFVPRDGGPKTIPNPWPHMTTEQAARNRLREAFFSLSRRRIFQNPSRNETARGARARRTFNLLANAVCYGHEGTSRDFLLWPDEHRVRTKQAILARAPVTDLLGEAHKEYGSGRLDAAQAIIDRIDRSSLDDAVQRRVGWLEAMVAFRRGDFGQALRLFPGPAQGKRDFWWTRDVAMQARLEARNGHGHKARGILRALEPIERWLHRALPVEYHAVSALACLAERDHDGAEERAAQALRALGALRDATRERDANLGDPLDIHPATVQLSILDLAAVLAASGRVEQAVAEITRLGGLDGWEFHYLRRDPLLQAVLDLPATRVELEAWEEQERSTSHEP